MFTANLEEYMYKHDLNEETVINILKGIKDEYIDENDFHFEIEGDTAYIETKGTTRHLEIINQDLEKGFIELRAVKND